MLRMAGWLSYHTHRSDRSPAGFPDVCAVRGLRVIFAELKRNDTHPTPSQIEWLNRLARTGVEVYLWRPWDAQEVARIVARNVTTPDEARARGFSSAWEIRK